MAQDELDPVVGSLDVQPAFRARLLVQDLGQDSGPRIKASFMANYNKSSPS